MNPFRKLFQPTPQKAIEQGKKENKKIENNGDLSVLPTDLFNIMLTNLDLKSLLNVRILSREHLEKIQSFLNNIPKAAQFGIAQLSPQTLYAVGQNVKHIKYGISDVYGKPIQPDKKAIKESFTQALTLFQNKEEAEAYIHKKTETNDFGWVEEKPLMAEVTVKNPNTLFRTAKEEQKQALVLTVKNPVEITEKLTFNAPK